jgi:hypothetical protein
MVLIRIDTDKLSRQEKIDLAYWLLNTGNRILRDISDNRHTPPMRYDISAPTGDPQKLPELQELARVIASWGVCGE